jgi:hypothetical protein
VALCEVAFSCKSRTSSAGTLLWQPTNAIASESHHCNRVTSLNWVQSYKHVIESGHNLANTILQSGQRFANTSLRSEHAVASGTRPTVCQIKLVRSDSGATSYALAPSCATLNQGRWRERGLFGATWRREDTSPTCHVPLVNGDLQKYMSRINHLMVSSCGPAS